MSEIVFEVKPDVTGGYYASAHAQSIFTQGDTIEELLANIREVLELYAEVSGETADVVTLRLQLNESAKFWLILLAQQDRAAIVFAALSVCFVRN